MQAVTSPMQRGSRLRVLVLRASRTFTNRITQARLRLRRLISNKSNNAHVFHKLFRNSAQSQTFRRTRKVCNRPVLTRSHKTCSFHHMSCSRDLLFATPVSRTACRHRREERGMRCRIEYSCGHSRPIAYERHTLLLQCFHYDCV